MKAQLYLLLLFVVAIWIAVHVFSYQVDHKQSLKHGEWPQQELPAE